MNLKSFKDLFLSQRNSYLHVTRAERTRWVVLAWICENVHKCTKQNKTKFVLITENMDGWKKQKRNKAGQVNVSVPLNP